MWAQSLSWTEALDRMQNHNQKLKGIEKQTEAATDQNKSPNGYPKRQSTAGRLPTRCSCCRQKILVERKSTAYRTR